MSLNDATLREAISTVVDPHTGQDFVASKALKSLRISGADVSVEVELGYPAKSLFPLWRQQLVAAIKQVPGVGQVTVQLSSRVVAHAAQRGVHAASSAKRVESLRDVFRLGGVVVYYVSSSEPRSLWRAGERTRIYTLKLVQ